MRDFSLTEIAASAAPRSAVSRPTMPSLGRFLPRLGRLRASLFWALPPLLAMALVGCLCRIAFEAFVERFDDCL